MNENLGEITTYIEGKQVVVGYIETIEKFDHVFNLNKDEIACVYNNDYKLSEIINKLEIDYRAINV